MKKHQIILVILLLLHFQSSLAQTDHLHLSFMDSQKNRKERMAITWTGNKSSAGLIKYGRDSSDLNAALAVTSKPISGQNNLFSYKAALNNLLPGTTYYYKCSSAVDGSAKTNPEWSALYSFTTAPEKGSKNKFTIGVWGDTQNNKGNENFEETSKIVNQLMKYPLSFTVHVGDIVENGSVASSWKTFLHTAQPLNANVPLMPVAGNHDVVNAQDNPGFQRPFPIFNDLFNLPGDHLNYSYNYGNVHFVAINSGYCQGAEKVGRVLFQQDSPEYKWLDNDLAKARKDKTIEWIILYDHYPVYSFGVSQIRQWQNQITPIIDKYKIDLVLSGHRHVYERHAAIKGGRIQKQDDLHLYHKPLGTVYITNGSAGGSLQGIGGSDLPTMLYTPARKMYTYAVMTIADRQIQYDVYDDEGEKIDYFRIEK